MYSSSIWSIYIMRMFAHLLIISEVAWPSKQAGHLPSRWLSIIGDKFLQLNELSIINCKAYSNLSSCLKAQPFLNCQYLVLQHCDNQNSIYLAMAFLQLSTLQNSFIYQKHIVDGPFFCVWAAPGRSQTLAAGMKIWHITHLTILTLYWGKIHPANPGLFIGSNSKPIKISHRCMIWHKTYLKRDLTETNHPIWYLNRVVQSRDSFVNYFSG